MKGNSLKIIIASFIIIALLGFFSSNGMAVILPTAMAPGVATTPLMTTPTTTAPDVGGVPAFFPTAIMFGTAPSVPTAAGAFPAAMLAPTTSFAPGIGGIGGFGGIGALGGFGAFGGFGLTPFMFGTAPSVPTAAGTFPAAMLFSPTALFPAMTPII